MPEETLSAYVKEVISYQNSDDGETSKVLMSYGCDCCEHEQELTLVNIQNAIQYHKNQIEELAKMATRGDLKTFRS